MNKIRININTRLLAYFLFVTVLPLFILATTSTIMLNPGLNVSTFKTVNIKDKKNPNIETYLVTVPEDYFENLKNKNALLILRISLLAALAGISLAYLFSRSVTKPLSDIIKCAKAIENGNFSKRLEIDTPDEFGYMSQSFNSMAEALQKRHEFEETREDFVATLTHDLKVPLLANVQALEYMLKGSYGDLPEKSRFITQQLISNNNDLINMVNTILDTYKYEEGKQNLIKRKINLSKLVEECVKEIEPLCEPKAISLIFNNSAESFEPVVDRQEMKRVIMNLLGNAVAYMEREGKIEVDLKSDGSEIIFSVKDNGVGIDEKDMMHLFERYSKGSKSLRKIGTGLGLYLSKHIVEAHSGKIWAQSTKGQGSVFSFIIPTEGTEKF